MFRRISSTFNAFPRQFWLVAVGLLISSTGSSIIWPFQLIYVSSKLQQPMTTVATLISISAATGLVVSLLGGSLADRFGRKPVMFFAQASFGLAYLLMSRANSYLGFLLPMTVMGAAQPLYAVGSDAMMADMVPAGDRTSAYSLLRMVNNAGIAIGPGIGGFIVSKSYSLAFYCAAAGMLAYSLILLFFTRETLKRQEIAKGEALQTSTRGYGRVLQDRSFVFFVTSSAIGMIAPLMMWTLLAIYTKTHYGLPEYLYSWLPITNALMCVFVQYFVTQVTRRHRPMLMIATGMLVYALGVGSLALMSSFWGFWVSMVVISFGELILIPTGTTYSANRAPEEMRGRYMGVYWLTWGLARAAAPVIGGFLHDQVGPKAIWYGGLTLGLLSTLALFILAGRDRTPRPESVTVPD